MMYKPELALAAMQKKLKKARTDHEYEESMEGVDKLNPKVRDVMAKTAVVKKV